MLLFYRVINMGLERVLVIVILVILVVWLLLYLF